jgi:hypothetical protein
MWREVEVSPDRRSFIFSAPLDRAILRCLSDDDGCRYLLFSDHTGIRVFNPPDKPGRVTICSHAATFLDQVEVAQLLEANGDMPKTAIIRA